MKFTDLYLSMCLPASRFNCADPTCREKAIRGFPFCPTCAAIFLEDKEKRASRPLSGQETHKGRSDAPDSAPRSDALPES